MRRLWWVVGGLVVCAGPVWAGKPAQVKLQKTPATIEGIIDPIVTVSPTVLTLKAGDQGTVTWRIQVPATETNPAKGVLWAWPHPDGFLAISGWVEMPGYTIPGRSVSNQAVVTWDGGGYATSSVVTVEVLPVNIPPIGEALALPSAGGTWQAGIAEIQPGNLATVAITVGAP